MPSILDHEVARAAILAILIERLGGTVKLTQADFDTIAHKTLLEDALSDGSLEFSVVVKQ